MKERGKGKEGEGGERRGRRQEERRGNGNRKEVEEGKGDMKEVGMTEQREDARPEKDLGPCAHPY